MDEEIRFLVEHFGLSPLPVESTYVVNTYRSSALTPEGRHAATAMIGLYWQESRSLFHRLPQDEVWHFYGGDPLRLVLLHEDGRDEDVVLGSDLRGGQRVQHVVPGGTWQAGEMLAGGRWSLFGCTLAPGFSGELFASGYADELAATHPQRAADIARLGVPRHEPGTLATGFL